MKKWLPTILTLFGGAAASFAPQLQHVAGQYPTATGLLVTIAGLVLHMLEGPVTTSVPKE